MDASERHRLSCTSFRGNFYQRLPELFCCRTNAVCQVRAVVRVHSSSDSLLRGDRTDSLITTFQSPSLFTGVHICKEETHQNLTNAFWSFITDPCRSGILVNITPARYHEQRLLRAVEEMHKEIAIDMPVLQLFRGTLVPSVSGLPRLTMNPSVHISPPLAIRSSPPHNSHIAAHALGAISLAGTTWCLDMCERSVVHVDLSLGSMPSRCHTFLVHQSHLSKGMAPGTRRKPNCINDVTCSLLSVLKFWHLRSASTVGVAMMDGTNHSP